MRKVPRGAFQFGGKPSQRLQTAWSGSHAADGLLMENGLPSGGMASWGLNRRYYGGVAIDTFNRLEGAHWHGLTEDIVQVTRHPQDQQARQVRVVVVQGDPPYYDSLVDRGDWQDIAQHRRGLPLARR